MAKTLFDLTGHASTPNVADLLEERWHNEGVTKGIQHKAVLGLLRHVQSPEGMFTFMPTGMAHQLKPTDPMVGEIIGKLESLTSVSPRLAPSEIKVFKDIALAQKDLMTQMAQAPSKYSAKYKDRPRKYLEDMLRYRRENLGTATDAPEVRRVGDVIERLSELEATPRTPHMGKVRGAESFLEKKILKAMEEYRRLGTTEPGTATATGFSFQRLIDLLK